MKKTAPFSRTGFSARPFVQTLKWISCVLFSFVVFNSCKKDASPTDPVVRPPDVITDRTLRIAFDQTTITAALVDSSFAIFKKAGSNNQYIKRFDRAGNMLELAIDDLSKGEWTAELTIFARAANDTATRAYFQKRPFNQGVDSLDVIVKAPNGSITDTWKPRLVLADKSRQVQLIVAMDLTDPYFEIHMPDRTWMNFSLERNAFKRDLGNELIAREKWTCSSGCFNSDNWIVNSTAFENFSNLMKTKTWNNAEIEAEFSGAAPDKLITFFYAYKK